MRSIIYILVFNFVFFGCQNGDLNEGPKEGDPNVFFDLKGYFEGEISRLNEAAPKVKKIANLNGDEEILEHQMIDFAQELDIFVNSDINKLSWGDKYSGDTTFQSGSISKITYKVLDESLRTKFLEINFNDGQVSSVVVENAANSLVASSQQKLNYQPETGFSITHNQDLVGSGDRNLAINILFEK